MDREVWWKGGRRNEPFLPVRGGPKVAYAFTPVPVTPASNGLFRFAPRASVDARCRKVHAPPMPAERSYRPRLRDAFAVVSQ